MSVHVDRSGLFVEKLKSGINIFTGAGFSCLPDAYGKSLPTAKNLSVELCEKFKLPDAFIDDLEALSALAPKQQLQEFLRNKFTITEYNKSYNTLNKINILSYVTTNIDNIIHKVTDNSTRYFLSSITYYGATQNARNRLAYIPLHGDVIDPNSTLYFGKFDLANVEKANTDLFQLMHGKLLERPTLFWGYGFHDSGVLKTVSRLLEHSPHDIWVQCMPDDVKSIELYRAKGCNIIIADTQELFDWIDSGLEEFVYKDSPLIEREELKPYFIPTISSVESVPIKDYYQKGNTHWHPILAKGSFEMPIVNNLYDMALQNKNIILIGGRFTGKTTILMQLALKVDSINKLYVEKLTPEQAAFIVTQIGDAQTWVFYHNCAEDIEAFKVFARVANIKVIGITEDYQFETTKHLLTGISYKVSEVSELDERQAQLLFEHIPSAIRKKQFTYKDVKTEKYSMLEMVSKNVYGIQTKDNVRGILHHLLRNDTRAFDAVALAAYLSANGSALSIDVIFPYFSVTVYREAIEIITQAKSLLSQQNFELCRDEVDQDYFILRSRLFAYYANDVLIHDLILKKQYGRVIERFTLEVSPYRIFRYDIFRRKAHDSDLFYELFREHANDIYSYLYDYDKNPYILQQWALCRSKLGDFANAFIDIDNALNQRPNNFSMKNSQAIILFEANRNQKTALAIDKMKESMDILRACYNNDKRKVYHAQKFAEFSLVLSNQYSDSEYIDEAAQWIKEVIERGDSNSRATNRLKRELDLHQKRR